MAFNWEQLFLWKNKGISQEAICRVNIPFKITVKNIQADVSMFCSNNLLEIYITA